MSRIAIIGAGAVGGTVGAWLSTSDNIHVTFCARTVFDRLTVETPAGLLDSVPRLITDIADAEPADWIVVATKTYDAVGAWPWIEALMGEGTRVAILQNGVEHLSRFPGIDAGRIVPAIVDIPAERMAPGAIVQRRTGSMVVPAARTARRSPGFSRTRRLMCTRPKTGFPRRGGSSRSIVRER